MKTYSQVLINNVGDINSRLYQISGGGKEAFISIITHYEIRRDFWQSMLPKKMKVFERFCRRFRILFLNTVEIYEKAAKIHTYLKKQLVRFLTMLAAFF